MADPDRFLAYLNREYGDVGRRLERQRRRRMLVREGWLAVLVAAALITYLIVAAAIR